MENGNAKIDDELLSAYVDGELTETERAQVEQRLETDSAARELVAEMRNLSNTLRQLPREELSETICPDVLGQIRERKVVLPTSEISLKRRVIWPALAIAAALILTFVYDDTVEKEMEVAKLEGRAEELRDEALREREPLAFEAPAPTAAPVEEAQALPTGEALGESHAPIASAPVAADTQQPAAMSPALRELAVENAQLGIVHLTLTDFPSGAERFDQLLISNGVQVLEEPSHAVQSELAASNAEVNGSAPAAETLSTRSASPRLSGGFGGLQSETLDEKSVVETEPEMVLVEAPPEVFEKILYTCNNDTEAIEAVKIDPTASGTNRAPEKQRLLDYQQYSRSGVPAESQGFSVTPAQQGMIAALNSIPNQWPESASAVVPSTESLEQGWATKLRVDQPVPDPRQVEAEVNERRNQFYSQQQSANVVKKLAKEKVDDQQPMRVLFLLHPSHDSAKK